MASWAVLVFSKWSIKDTEEIIPKITHAVDKISSYFLMIIQFYFIYNLSIVHFTLHAESAKQKKCKEKTSRVIFILSLILLLLRLTFILLL